LILVCGHHGISQIIELNGDKMSRAVLEERLLQAGEQRTFADDRIQDLQRQIEELRDRWPAHSVPAGMVELLDQLEEELMDALLERERQDK
jgi:hypothetical protein